MADTFICTKDFMLLSQMMQLQNTRNDLCIRGFSSSPILDPAFLLKQNINVLYVQFELIQDCWQSWFDAFQQLRCQMPLHLVLSFAQMHSEYIHFLLHYKVDAYLIEPFSVEQLAQQLVSQSAALHQEIKQQDRIEAQVVRTLMRLNIPTHLNGFLYLKTACEIALETALNRQIVMKQIYSLTAKVYHTTSIRVEKCMRSAVHAADAQTMQLLFQGNPTNRKIIMYVYACLKGIV